MKILIIADAKSIHTERWVISLANKGHEIILFSKDSPKNDKIINTKNVSLLVYRAKKIERYLQGIPVVRGFCSFFELFKLKQIIKAFKPDIVHAHYASHQGLIGALSGFHPLIISVWGTDVYTYPKESKKAKKRLEFMLSKADLILSTSHVMAKETNKYTNKHIGITPFGVDMNIFVKKTEIISNNKFIIGNVKTLAPKYGIDVLIQAAALVMKRNPEKEIMLEIYGEGPCRKEYERLTNQLGIADKTCFHGFVCNEQLPEIYNSFSVSVSVSDNESFGVVAVEAMSCGCPVVTSDADGFTEVVLNGETGIIVPKRDPKATADAIQKFIDDPMLREKMGNAGRKRVKELYDWSKNVDTMERYYTNLLSSWQKNAPQRN